MATPIAASIAGVLNAASFELLFFSGAFILLLGIDDLIVDAIWLTRPRARRQGEIAFTAMQKRPMRHRIAIFVPAWDERTVLHDTLAHALSVWGDGNYRIYAGCYPNDAQTIVSIAALAAANERLRIVVHRRPGPTTKGDCLNAVWRAMRSDERNEALRFDAIALHDAEDRVHAAELAVMDAALDRYGFVQLPVIPLLPRKGRWIAGHYCDEFAEAHRKELTVRHLLGSPIPAAGVGCCVRRDAIDLWREGGLPFAADSMVEDYELGLGLGRLGVASTFARVRDADGALIAVRSYFPATIETAIRQKARWIAGIALIGWDRLGWRRLRRGGRMIDAWMLWRDRRVVLAALVTLTAYFGLVGWSIADILYRLADVTPPEISRPMAAMLAATLALLAWRLTMRFVATAGQYGMTEGFAAIPRAFVSNIVAILAARRALVAYCRALTGTAIVWDKTAHLAHEDDGMAAARDR